MRTIPYINWVITAIMVAVSGTSLRAQVVQAVADFDVLVRNYNLISFGNASFSNQDTEGALAVGGNLTLSNVPVANISGATGSDPSLYVAGQLILSGDSHLNHGSAYIPNATGTFSGNTLTSGSGKLIINTGTGDPRTGSAPANWDWATIQSQAITISETLAAAAQTGTVAVNTGNQTLTFTATDPNASVVVFQLDASLLGSQTYSGSYFSNIAFSLGANQTAVVNVVNFNGKTLFGSGVNFNDNSGVADQLLWNFAGTGSVSLGNGGQFYGSVLAPTVNLSNALNTSINGQVVAGSLTYTNAELHMTAFSPTGLVVPEPSTYALWGAGLCAMGLVVRRWRAARVVQS